MGGVILVNRGHIHAASLSSTAFVILLYDLEKSRGEIWYNSGISDSNFEGLTITPGGFTILYKSVFYWSSVSIGSQFVIEGADFSPQKYAAHSGNVNISFQNNYTKAVFTLTDSGNTTSYGDVPNTHSGGIICFHIGAYNDPKVTVTAHIQLDET
jgi:hypothetical protein